MVRKYKKSRQNKRKKTHRVRYQKKKKTRRRKKKKTRRRRISKGGFIWTLPDGWETKLKDGKFMPQEWLDEHGKKRVGTVMNCATCVEMMAGLPTDLGFILSIWSEHGQGVRPMNFLKFLNKYFSMKTKITQRDNNGEGAGVTFESRPLMLIKWTAWTFREEQWKKCEWASQRKRGGCKMLTGGKWEFDDSNPYREWETILDYYRRRREEADFSTRGEWQEIIERLVRDLPPLIYNTPRSLYLNPCDMEPFLNRIKQMLPNNSGVLVYIYTTGGAHYIILAKSKDQNQLMYIDPQRKISYKGLDQIIGEFQSKGVFQLLLFIASPTYDTHKTDAKLAEKGMDTITSSTGDGNISFVINKKGFSHNVFKPKIIEIDKKFGDKRNNPFALYNNHLSVRDIHNARLLKSAETTSSATGGGGGGGNGGGGGGGGGGGDSGVHYYSDSILPWEGDRHRKWPWPPSKGQEGWMTPRQWKYSQKQASDFTSKGLLLPLQQSWNRKRSVLSELKKYDCAIGECNPLKKFSQPNRACKECSIDLMKNSELSRSGNK